MRKLGLVAAAVAVLAAPACSSTVDSGDGSYGQPPCTGADAVRPDGATFCYLRPPGTKKPDKVTFERHKFISGAIIDDDNGVVVGLTAVTGAYSKLSDDGLLRQVNSEYEAAGGGETTIEVGSGAVRKVPAGRMLGYDATESDHKVRVQIIFAGDTIIQVNCRWKDESKKDKVLDACDSVLGTMQRAT